MAESLNAKQVALDVIDAVRSGKKCEKGKIQEKNGYSKQSAISSKAIRTKTYQKTMKPFLDRMTAHRDKIQLAMEGKDLTKEQYKVLSDAMSKINHDVQLLSGGATENIKVYDWGNYDNLSTASLDESISREPKTVDGNSST